MNIFFRKKITDHKNARKIFHAGVSYVIRILGLGPYHIKAVWLAVRRSDVYQHLMCWILYKGIDGD